MNSCSDAMPHIDPRELNDLASFAANGGLGRGVARTDVVAEEPDQLMFITGDQLVLLRELPEVDLASCEGVVGWVKKGQVEFERPTSAASPSTSRSVEATPKTSLDVPSRDEGGLPTTILTAPSPSPPSADRMLPLETSPDDIPDDRLGLDAPTDSKRVSGPFELDSPQQSPNIDQASDRFSIQQAASTIMRDEEGGPVVPRQPMGHARPESGIEVEEPVRESVMSVASSMYGGIGGFMMGGGASSEDSHGTVQDTDEGVSPATASVETPFPPHSHPTSPRIVTSADESPSAQRSISPKTSLSPDRLNADEDEDDDWDIYDQYARESMYAPLKRFSIGGKRASKMTKEQRESMAGFDAMAAVNAARAALEGPNGSPLLTLPEDGDKEDLDPETPKVPAKNPLRSPLEHTTGRSLATELRLRIQRAREAANDEGDAAQQVTTALPERKSSLDGREDAKPSEGSPRSAPSPIDPTGIESEVESAAPPTAESEPPSEYSEPSTETAATPTLLASPMALESPKLEDPPKLEAPADIKPPEDVLVAPRPPRSASPLTALVPRPPADLLNPSPNTHLNPPAHSPWTPDSPASPHSITATRQAVEAAKAEGTKRPRGLTLVGKIDADLRVARGPVPITFVVGDADTAESSTARRHQGLGLGIPSTSNGRTSPVTPEQRSRSPLSASHPPPPPMPDDLSNIRSAPSRFPTPQRSFTSPVAPEQQVSSPVELDTAAGPRPGFFAARPRSRSFGAAMAKAVGRMKKDTPPSISTETLPSMPQVRSPSSPGAGSSSRLKLFNGRKSPRATSPAPTINGNQTPIASSSSGISSHHSTPGAALASLRDDSTPPLPNPASARSSSFSFSSKASKTPRKTSRALPSPVSHKDYEDTINAGGMDFELVQPKRNLPLSPTAINTLGSPAASGAGAGAGASDDGEKATLASASSMNSLSSRATVPDTDEWGFIKDKGVTPEIFQSRSAPIDHRAAESKWLTVIGSPVPSGGPPKKVKKYVIEGGVPSSLRGKVWSWFISEYTSGRSYTLSKAEPTSSTDQIEKDISRFWSDHSLFYLSTCPGYTDLVSILRAYTSASTIPYSTPMCHLAGTMLIHSVAEDSLNLLAGLVDGILEEYYEPKDRKGMRIDAGVFDVVLRGSEKDLASLFKQVGIKYETPPIAIEFLEKWYKQLFIRCLPWPTALRVIDVVVSEGPRFLLIASLTILTLSRERILALPKARSAVLGYLDDLPQDSLLLPENFMKATERVKFKEEDWKRLRAGVEKDLMGQTSQGQQVRTPNLGSGGPSTPSLVSPAK